MYTHVCVGVHVHLKIRILVNKCLGNSDKMKMEFCAVKKSPRRLSS